jgi:hypothetical protein
VRIFTNWLFKAWPLLSFIPIYLMHFLLLESPCLASWLPCLNNAEINKLTGLTFQVSGGLLILYSIDSNLGHFKDNGLFKIFNGWFKACPIVKGKNQVIQVSTIASTSTIGNVNLRSDKTPKTDAEKLAHLQQQIEWIREDNQKDKNELVVKIDNVSNKIDTNYTQTERSITLLNSKLESVTVGGLKWQVFGFNLLVYSAILSYVA